MEHLEHVDVEVTIPAWKAYLIAFALIFLMPSVTIIPHVLIHGGNLVPQDMSVLMIMAVFLVSIAFHELLHAVGFVYFGRISWKNIKFGFSWKSLVPYVSQETIVSVAVYRVAGALPAIALGLIPAMAGLISGIGWLASYGYFMLAVSGGDFAILLATRMLPSDARLVDHPKKLGCLVLLESSSM